MSHDDFERYDDEDDNVVPIRKVPDVEKAARAVEISEEDLAKLKQQARSAAAKEVVLLKSPDYFVKKESDGRYRGPLKSDEVRSVLEEECPGAASAELPNRKGETLIRTASGSMRDLSDIVQRVGTVLKGVRLVAHVPGKRRDEYDPEKKVITREVAEWRTDVEPRYDERIDEWLSKLCGPRVGKVLDWLATFRLTDTPTCAPYIEGVPSAGKEMLAAGLAKLTEYGCMVRYEHLTSDFNDLLLHSLFVFADEKMPDQGSKRGAPSAVFRSLIGTDCVEINTKGGKKTTLEGCPRVLICANNARALNLVAERLESNDVEAIGKRVLHVRSDDDGRSARDYLRSLGGRKGTKSWVEGLGIAAHVLWLEQNRVVAHGHSYAVEGDGSAVKRLIVGHEMDAVLEALCRYVDKYGNTKAERSGLGGVRPPTRSDKVIPGGGVLFVNGPAILSVWGELMPGDKRVPGTGEIGRMLANLSDSGRKHRDVAGSRVAGYEVSAADIVNAAESLGVGDSEKMRDLLMNGERIAQGVKIA